MRVWYCDHHEVALPAGHRFPMSKYARLREELVGTGVLAEAHLFPAEAVSREDLERAHGAAYVEAFLSGTLPEAAIRRIGLPWSRALVHRSLASVGGTLAAARHALHAGIAGNLAGGTHHAFADFGAGYCVFNDLVVASRALLATGSVERVLVVDLDVHQGDGTAALCADDPRVFTLSVHGARNFPFRKQRSDLDVELPDGTGDDAYLAAVRPALAAALERARPDLILYQAGVDPLREDRLGRLHLSAAGLRQRDAEVLDSAWRWGIPVALTLGGGYAEPLAATIAAHVGTYRAVRKRFG